MKRWPIVLALFLAVTAVAKGGYSYYVARHDAQGLYQLAEYCGTEGCQVRFSPDGSYNALNAQDLRRIERERQQQGVTRPSTRF